MIAPKRRNNFHRNTEEGQIFHFNDNDVLCGRGSGPNDHIGNIAFRRLVSTRRKEYLDTTTRSQKAKIAKEIVAVVTNLLPTGRFLEKVTGTSWKIVPEGKALEKVKQALRQMRHRRSMDLTGASTNKKTFGRSSYQRRNSAPPIFGQVPYQSSILGNDVADEVYSNNLQIPQIGNSNEKDDVLLRHASHSMINSQSADIASLKNNNNLPVLSNESVPHLGNLGYYQNTNIVNRSYIVNLTNNRQQTSSSSLESMEMPVSRYPVCKTIHQADLEPEPIHIKSNGDIVFRKYLKHDQKKCDEGYLHQQFAVIGSPDMNISGSISDQSITTIESELDPQPFSIDLESDTLDDDATAQQYLDVVLALDDVQKSIPDMA
jgi:hypothetical protein